MLERLKRLGRIPTKIISNAKLLRRDPERFGRNLMQVTNPALFEQRLLDVHNAVPMHVHYLAEATGPPTLNVLDAAWTVLGMTGGPNTVINLACRIAQQGVSVRLVSTMEAPTIDPRWFRSHAKSLLGDGDVPDIPIVSAAQADQPLRIGPQEVFLATHWTTAQQLKAVLPRLPIRQFFYMLQEFEPGFYAWSSNFALAVETYGLDFWPIVNEAILADYLLAQPLGRLNDPVTRQRAVVFEPAVDSALFYPASPDASRRPRRLLFYARPTNMRNMFGLALKALRQAVADPVYAGWDFVSIGSRGSVPDLPLGHGHVMRPAPWMDYAGYGDLLRKADILLCPMLSPHTSYPVLEMAASGGLSVTNTFATKTAESLNALSRNILAVEPTIAGFADGMLEAARRVNAGAHRPTTLNMPCDWGVSLDPVARRVAAIIRELVGSRLRTE